MSDFWHFGCRIRHRNAKSAHEHVSRSRRLSFGPVAELYDRARPAYAAQALDWALPTGTRHVLDLAAGTGKLTALLVARGLDVIAVDPSEQMLTLLHAKLPGVDARVASAENTGLASASVDAVVIGSALHWFERPAADVEIARVLRPGGVVGVFQNRRDTTVAWIGALDAMLDDASPQHRHPEQWRALRVPFDPAYFGAAEVAEFSFGQELDAFGLADLFASRSYLIQLEPGAREAVLDKIRDFARTHPDLTGRDRFTVPYRTVVVRYRRL